MDRSPLSLLADLAAELERPELAAEARAQVGRAAEGRFYVVCLGQFKRGKSSLIDALVGEPVLPVGMLPVTSVPTVVRFGTERRARVQLAAGRWIEIAPADLARYVAEEHSPENAKHVTGVEVFLPSPVLEDGLCLVDTPGVGSVFAANTEAARAFIPHVDAALVVLGVEPPLTADELTLVADVGAHVKDFIVVLNKADRSTAPDRALARQFAERELASRIGAAAGEILEVSARERLEGTGPDRDWPRLMGALRRLAERSGAALAARAEDRGVRRVARQLGEAIARERAALQQPLAVTERRAAELSAAIADAERALGDLAHLFDGEQQRLARAFAAQRREFLGAELAAAQAEIDAALAAVPDRGRRLRRAAMTLAQDIARRRIEPWLAAASARGEEAYRAAAGRFVDLAEGHLTRAAAAGVDLPAARERLEAAFRIPSTFRFYRMEYVAADVSTLLWLVDLARGVLGLRRGIARDARRFVAELLEVNSSRVEGDLTERVLESRRKLESEVWQVLAGQRRQAEALLERVRALHAQGEAAVADRLETLDQLERQVASVSPFAPPRAP